MRAWLLWLALCLAASLQAGTIHRIATYNIRLQLESDRLAGNGWETRRAAVLALMHHENLEIVGVQEALAPQLDDLLADGTYRAVGVGRDDGVRAGEFSALLYRPDLWSVIDSGTFWLSETPDQVSFGWDAQKYRRICTWAQFRNRVSGAVVHVWNVHFDHEAVVARRESARLLLQKSASLRGSGAACVLLGDFNCTSADEPYRLLAAEWKDARLASLQAPEGPSGTFNGFRFGAEPTERIDHVFVTPAVEVLRHLTLGTSQNGRYPSDHFPVVVDIQIRD